MKKHDLHKCPCCQEDRNLSEIKSTVSQLEKLDRTAGIWNYNGSELFEKFPLKDFSWACDYCLESKKAILANPMNQKFLDYRPHLAYFDSKKECKTCKKEFVFSGIEKKYWFEELKFWVQSDAVRCLECRKSNRLLKELSRLLSKGEDNLDSKEIERTIELYDKLGKAEKVKYFVKMNKKKATTPPSTP